MRTLLGWVISLLLCFFVASVALATPGPRRHVVRIHRPSFSAYLARYGRAWQSRHPSRHHRVTTPVTRTVVCDINRRYGLFIKRYARAYGVDWRRVTAIVAVESGGNPRARSNTGAMGLMQLMPETAKDMAVADPWDPRQNIRGGVGYLRFLKEKKGYHGNARLVAYNEGPTGARSYLRRHRPEDHSYVRRVLRTYKIAKEVFPNEDE